MSFVTNLSASANVVDVADVLPSIMFNSAAVDVIEVPAICNVVALTSPLEPYITALLFAIVPADEPSTKFNSEAVDVTPSRMLSSAVVEVTPSRMLSSAAVDVTPSNIFNSAVVEVTPSKMFISVAVAVTATSSFIFGLVNVLLVSVCVETKSTTYL